MSVTSPQLRRADVPDVVLATCFGPSRSDRVGLELELFPVRRGDPTTRVALHGPDGSWAALARAAGTGEWCGPTAPVGDPIALVGGGNLTAEPGGQLEVSAGVEDDVDGALDALHATTSRLVVALADDGIDLASAGTDLWTHRPDVRQQLPKPRYEAMDAYLSSRGPWGRVMMRHTASLQVNLDAGEDDRLVERFATALLLGPWCVATFAASPTADLADDGAWAAVSERAVAWQRLDPTRTGTPEAFVHGHRDPVAVMVDAALRADVLLVADAHGGAVPGRAGWTFGDWVDGHGPRPVTVADLVGHLTTLFHDVRPRGPLELRAVDGLPAGWRDVPAVLLIGALYDDEACSRIRALLEPTSAQLPQLSVRAALTGLRDPEMCATAVEVWSFALAGASRLGVSSERRARVEAFLDRFTLRGLTPADRMADLGRAELLTHCLEPRTTSDDVAGRP